MADFIDHPRHQFIHGDICDEDLLFRICKEGVDTIVNFAAESHVDRSIESPDAFLRTNILGVQALIDAAIRCNISKLMHISTDEVYGDLDESGVFSEQSPMRPSSPYAASKASADLLLQASRRTYGVPYVICRSGNNYGPYQHPEKLIPRMITRALNGQSLPLYGNGKNVRDWIHVSDHCEALLTVLETGSIGQIYNISSNDEHRNIDIVTSICDHFSVPTSRITYVEDRPGHDWRYAIDPTKIRNQLGWRPQVSFEQGLKHTLKWYQGNQSWWQSILQQTRS